MNSKFENVINQNSQELKSEKYLTSVISLVLQVGVIISALVIIIGLYVSSFKKFSIISSSFWHYPYSIEQIIKGIVLSNPPAVISLGLLILIAVPILRVFASVITFVVFRDRSYFIITLFVLAILLFSNFYTSHILSTKVQYHLILDSNIYASLLVIFLGAIIAGIFGALVGLGGGILIVPLLTLVFKFPIYIAIGASIISIIATSSESAALFVKEHMVNLRVGMFLEIATSLGAIGGAFLAGLLAPNILSVLFGIILFILALTLHFNRNHKDHIQIENDSTAEYLKLNSSYEDRYNNKKIAYNVTRTPFGLVIMYFAGLISGILGIGSGTFKVLGMDMVMGLPMKVSTTTSSMMIGVTAAASAGIYFSRGDIVPLITAPVALGTLLGAFIGSHLFKHLSSNLLTGLFQVALVLVSIEMVLQGMGFA